MLALLAVVHSLSTGAGLQAPVDPYALAPGGLPLTLHFEDIHIYGLWTI